MKVRILQFLTAFMHCVCKTWKKIIGQVIGLYPRGRPCKMYQSGHQNLGNVESAARCFWCTCRDYLGTIHDVLFEFAMKPHMHLVEIIIFSVFIMPWSDLAKLSTEQTKIWHIFRKSSVWKSMFSKKFVNKSLSPSLIHINQRILVGLKLQLSNLENLQLLVLCSTWTKNLERYI